MLVHGYRARMFIPCVNGRCPGRMQLRIVTDSGEMLDRPFYLCDQDGKRDRSWTCRNHSEPVFADELRGEYVGEITKAREAVPKYRSDDSLAPDEMEHMI